MGHPQEESQRLAAEIDDFYRNWAIKRVVAYRRRVYMKQVKELKDPTGRAEYQRFSDTLALSRVRSEVQLRPSSCWPRRAIQESQLIGGRAATSGRSA